LRTATSVQSAESRAVAFGRFTFDRTSRLLFRDGVEVPLPPRVLGVLSLLLERPGEIVTKQELITAVWRDAFVTETSLAEAVSVLRQTLGDDPQHPTYIQTLHRRGYRFIAELQDAMPRTRNGFAAASVVAAEADVERAPRLALLVPWLIALFALLTAGAAVWRYVTTVAPLPPQPVRFTLALPSGLTLATSGAPVAVSQDGRLIAFAACREGDCGIYLRPLSQAQPTLVAGTAGATSPFFSPNARSLGFFANGQLQTIALAGGSSISLAEAAEPLGAAWLRDGRIVFARGSAEGLFTVGDNGGTVRPLTRPLAGEGGHRWPAASPDNSALVFTVAANREYAGAVSMRTGTWGRLLDDVTAARVPVSGFLVAQRGSDLVASIFDERARSITGLPVPVAALESSHPTPQFAMSAAGTLVIAQPGANAMQVLLDWTGELRRLVPASQPALPR
jgi:DNA-binding winged helix-turn-helix (wHTH) protein